MTLITYSNPFALGHWTTECFFFFLILRFLYLSHLCSLVFKVTPRSLRHCCGPIFLDSNILAAFLGLLVFPFQCVTLLLIKPCLFWLSNASASIHLTTMKDEWTTAADILTT